MGLDMYAYSVAKDEVEKEIAYWRKHNALHGWMKNLYNDRAFVTTGESPNREFNGVEVELTRENLNELKQVVEGNNLPETNGFFFGTDSRFDNYRKEEDLKFIKDALEQLDKGNTVFYNSSW